MYIMLDLFRAINEVTSDFAPLQYPEHHASVCLCTCDFVPSDRSCLTMFV